MTLQLHARELSALSTPYVQPSSTPQVRSTSTTGTADSQVAARSVPIPAGAQAGDVVQVAIEFWDSTAVMPTITPPNGWTEIVSYASSSDGFQKLKVWQKALRVAEAGSWTFSGFGSHFSQGQALAASGCDLSSPLDGAVHTAQTTNSVNTLPANTKTTTQADLVVLWVANENSSTQTPPTGFTEQQEANYLKLSTKIQGAAGNETISDGSQSVNTLKLGALYGINPMATGGAAMNLGTATGTGAAQSLALSKALTLGAAAGSGTPQALATTKALDLGAPTGVGAPQPMSFAKAWTLGQAAGAGAAQALTPGKALSLEQAAGSGAPQAATFTAGGGTTLTLGTAAGTGTPQAMSFTKAWSAGVATSSGAPQALAAGKALQFGAAAGTGTARALVAAKALGLERAAGAGAAQAVSWSLMMDYTAPHGWAVRTSDDARAATRARDYAAAGPGRHTAITRRTPYTAATREGT